MAENNSTCQRSWTGKSRKTTDFFPDFCGSLIYFFKRNTLVQKSRRESNGKCVFLAFCGETVWKTSYDEEIQRRDEGGEHVGQNGM